MPGKRSCYEYKHRVLREILSKYREATSMCFYINMKNVVQHVKNSEYSRFFVSEDRSVRVIQKMIRLGGECPIKTPSTQEMYEEIYKRVMLLLNSPGELSLEDAVIRVVNAPAPKLYLSDRKTYEKINEAKQLCKTRPKH